MKTAYAAKDVVAGLAAVILVGLLAWLISSEGERTRRKLRVSRRAAETSPSVVPQPSQDKRTRSADTSVPASVARDKSLPASEPNQQEPGIATAADSKPAAAESEAGAEEHFNLDDHLVFPGLADEASKTRAKPRVDRPAEERKSDAKEPHRTGSK